MAVKLSPVEELKRAISPIPEIIEEAREGRMFILVDAEDRQRVAGVRRRAGQQPLRRMPRP